MTRAVFVGTRCNKADLRGCNFEGTIWREVPLPPPPPHASLCLAPGPVQGAGVLSFALPVVPYAVCGACALVLPSRARTPIRERERRRVWEECEKSVVLHGVRGVARLWGRGWR